MIPKDLAPWSIVLQQAQRWITAVVLKLLAHDLRNSTPAGQRSEEPPHHPGWTHFAEHARKRRARAGYAGYKRKKDRRCTSPSILGHLLALKVTAANEQEGAQVATLLEEVQAITGGKVKVAFADQVHRRKTCGPCGRACEAVGGGETRGSQTPLRLLPDAGSWNALCVASRLPPLGQRDYERSRPPSTGPLARFLT